MRPNILLVSIDTLRADALEQAPFLRTLAARGRSFERTWASANWTLPSHVSLFTSTPVLEHDTPRATERRPFIGAGSNIPGALPMLAEILAAAGYRTGATTGGGYVAPEFGFVRGFERYLVAEDGSPGAFARHLDFAKEFVAEVAPAPFFLFAHTYAVHDYFENDERYHAFVDPDANGARMREGRYLDAIVSGRASADYAHRLYAAGVRRTDAFVRSLVEGILRWTADAPLLVIVTSDHGESFGHGDGSWHHGTSLEEAQLRIPLLAWGNFPGAPAGGSDVSPTSLIDIAPSLLTFLGVDPPPTFRGAKDRLTARPASGRRFPVVASTPHTTRPAGTRRLDQAIVGDGIKYVRTDDPTGRTTSQTCEVVGPGLDPRAYGEVPLARCEPLERARSALYERVASRVLVVRTTEHAPRDIEDSSDADRPPSGIADGECQRSLVLRPSSVDGGTSAWGAIHVSPPSAVSIADPTTGRVDWPCPRHSTDVRLIVHGARPPQTKLPAGYAMRWRPAPGGQSTAETDGAGHAPSADLIRRLEALGYVDEQRGD